MKNIPSIEEIKAFLKPYLTPEILTYAGIGLGVLVVIIIVVKLLSKKAPGKHYQVVGCRACGWHGEVSRWAGQCPQCNKPLGDQKLQQTKK